MTASEHIQDTIVHKQLVLESGLKLINYLMANQQEDAAIQLARRCARHDDSKFESDEMQAFLQLPKEKQNMKEASSEMPEQVKKFVSMHWKHNRHHPEFYDDYHEMKDLDIMEMVCDWYARSLQFETDFKDFVKIRQKTRFKFDKDFFDKVWFYCELIGEN